jgi:hypothetical protein
MEARRLKQMTPNMVILHELDRVKEALNEHIRDEQKHTHHTT